MARTCAVIFNVYFSSGSEKIGIDLHIYRMAHWKVPLLFGDRWQVDFWKPDSGLYIRKGEFGGVRS